MLCLLSFDAPNFSLMTLVTNCAILYFSNTAGCPAEPSVVAQSHWGGDLRFFGGGGSAFNVFIGTNAADLAEVVFH